MPESISKTQRWLDLIAYLVGRRLPVSLEEIMEQVPAYAERWRSDDDTARATARRTFERDKDELRRLGIPLTTVPYTVHYGAETLEGYQIIRRDFYLPYLELLARTSAPAPAPAGDRLRVAEVELREEEAQLAFDALSRMADLPAFPMADEARAAYGKLAFDLDAESFPAEPVLFAERHGAGELVQTLRLLSDALLDHKRVRFRYRGIHRDEVTERDVAPFGLFFRGDWYLVGHDSLRDAVRVFRVARMEQVEMNRMRPRTPDYQIPTDFRLDAYLGREAWELGGDADEPDLLAEVLFRFPTSLWAERNRYGREIHTHADGAAVRRFAVRQVNPFLRWILSLEGEAEILGPSELRAELEAMATAVAAVHRVEGVADG